MRESERDFDSSRRLARVVVVSAIGLLRSALVHVLGLRGRLGVVGNFRCDEEVAEAVAQLAADVGVVDVDVSCGQCLATVFALRKRMPSCRLVVLADAGVSAAVRQVVEAGVRGLVDRCMSATHLVEVVERVAGGEVVLDTSLAAATWVRNPLKPREADVLRAAAAGLDGREIARRLELSPGTVRNYVSRAMSKTGAHSRIDAIRIATAAGWLL